MKPDATTPSPARLLLVDDEPRVRTAVRALLAMSGYEIDDAGSTDAALGLLHTRTYDVMLVDIDMPPRSGLELLDEIRAQAIDVVPVVLTGTTDVGSAVTAMKRGAFDYLSKPPARMSLLWVLDRARNEANSRRRERALRNLAAEWSATFDACPDPMAVFDAEDELLRINLAAAAQIQEVGLPMLDGPSVTSLLDPDLPAMRIAARVTGLPQRRTQHNAQLGLVIEIFVKAFRNQAVAVIWRDITEQVRAQEVQADLLRRLIAAREAERGRLARELHDGVAQSIVTIGVGLSGLSSSATGDERTQLMALAQTTHDTLDELRRLAHGLRPLVLDDLGLVAAVGRLARDCPRPRVELVVTSQFPQRLAPDLESSLYRIVQEALANVVKHAKATTIDITLDGDERSVHVSVSDDGCGATDVEPGMGLADMRERAQLLGGQFEFTCRLGRGCTVHVAIPLTKAQP